jgi:hypothetical protein
MGNQSTARSEPFVGGRVREVRIARSLFACATSFESISTPVTEAAWKAKAVGWLVKRWRGIIACRAGAGVGGSLTELARYASRVAADVETCLGGKQAWNQLVGDQTQAGIYQVNGSSRGICRVAIVLFARSAQRPRMQLPDRFGSATETSFTLGMTYHYSCPTASPWWLLRAIWDESADRAESFHQWPADLLVRAMCR